ncbi:hypothetical protein [Neisseria wadsworthii]|uniref:Uncharacterized protein n=1 Tax=Neisseria wadsworthii 9715 TaxID=1030841 RepID=G4CTD8_9NEIS|nr:hypothetical protein [Neisseria wadsworthii]EGZ44256.1 hypothetical protein HMPREF9370_2348 [Neisseria wadsworthii 9715]QMT35927.1 hypothetical protein H3L96_01300 [Neisseria wadsworthii]
MSEPAKKRGWASLFIYAATILSASSVTRYYAIEEPTASIIMIFSIFLAERIYILYRKLQ